MKIIILLAFFSLIVFVFVNSKAYAQEKISGSSATLSKSMDNRLSDSRIRILEEYLKQHNSPLTPHAKDFVEIADKYDLDWKLVASISGLESTFGKHIPYNSYNGWGWGVYGDNVIRFSSWTEGIETVSEGLRNKYMDQWGAKDVYQIGRYYAASPTWAQRVIFFMNRIDEFKDKKHAANLPISL